MAAQGGRPGRDAVPAAQGGRPGRAAAQGGRPGRAGVPAARGGRADGRDVAEEVHQGPWLHNVGNDPMAAAKKEEEIRRLKAKGIAVEAVTEYVLEDAYVHPNPRITKLNSDIVKKLNGLSKHHMQWQEAGADVGQQEDAVFALRNISNLKKQITRIQEAVKASGGRPVPLPPVFEEIPEP